MQLQAEEGDAGLDELRGGSGGLVWARTRTWAESAARLAPLATEALLHSFLTSSDALPVGAVAAATAAPQEVWQQQQPADEAAAAALVAASNSSNSGAAPWDEGVSLHAAGGGPVVMMPCGADRLDGSWAATSFASFTTADGGAAGGRHQARIATQAAFRRAADLLQTCSAARRRLQPGQPVADGAYEGALGLTRKLHYTGYVQV